MTFQEIKARSELKRLTLAELNQAFRSLCAEKPQDGRVRVEPKLLQQISQVRDEIIIRKHRA